MTNRAWRFGDVVRVDPAKNPKVRLPDDRRWMVVVAASVSGGYPWTLMYCGPLRADLDAIIVSHWKTMHGFILVEDE